MFFFLIDALARSLITVSFFNLAKESNTLRSYLNELSLMGLIVFLVHVIFTYFLEISNAVRNPPLKNKRD